MTTKISLEDARRIGDIIGANWADIAIDEFVMGMAVELEHGTANPETDITHDDPILTGKIALAHLRELPDYYTRLRAMKNDGDATPQ